ncbi:MAG: homoprotocatechuate degradation operon regulator HpaR [Sulfuritalea sp.]|nr:homoprotocatechuate degradation operon regulator HpaR [Sulfuritalea sp.]
MKRKTTYSNLPQLLLRAREELLSHFRPILNHYGLTEPQWRIMRVLSEREQLEPREICELCQILSPSLAGILTRMEALNLVVRTRFPDDQRRVLVRLSARSEKLVASIMPLVEAQYAYLEEAVGKGLMTTLYSVLDDLDTAKQTPVKRITLPALPRP